MVDTTMKMVCCCTNRTVPSSLPTVFSYVRIFQYRTLFAHVALAGRKSKRPVSFDAAGVVVDQTRLCDVVLALSCSLSSEQMRVHAGDCSHLGKSGAGYIWHTCSLRRAARSRRRHALGDRPPPHSSPSRRLAVHVLLHLRRVNVASVRVIHVYLLLARS